MKVINERHNERNFNSTPSRPLDVYEKTCPCCGSDLEFTAADIGYMEHNHTYRTHGLEVTTSYELPDLYVICPVDGYNIMLGKDSSALCYLLKDKKKRRQEVARYEEKKKRRRGFKI